jgi:cysteine desulfurase / selenocysteine lyase
MNAPVFDVERVRADFPILSRLVHAGKDGRNGKPLIYLDNGASAQKPRAVIDRMTRFLEEDYSNVHRGVHYLSQTASDAYDGARTTVAKFLNAPSDNTIVFTRNSTESINLVAATWGRKFLEKGDEIVVSALEHHANIVPWQMLATEKGLKLKVVPIDERGVLDMSAYADLLGGRTKLVAITHCSNVTGTVTPAAEIVRLAHERGIPVLLDGSQAVVHGPVDVQALDVDFYVFTGHKLYGPTGIGVLYGKYDLLKSMPPYQGGGDMIEAVSFEGTTFRAPPARFEAGTPAIVEAVGLAAAIDYLGTLDLDGAMRHEQALLERATAKLLGMGGVRIQGLAPGKAPIISFTVEGVHPHDLGTVIDQYGVAIRVGRHCAEPLMKCLGVASTARASFALYNTTGEIDALVEAVKGVKEFFGA